MAILENEASVSIKNNTKKYYSTLGYDINSNKISVKTKDLQPSSNVRVTKICDNCGKHIPNTPYFAIIKQRKNNVKGLDLCKTCKNRLVQLNKISNNSLQDMHPELANEWIQCMTEGCFEYTPDMVSKLSNHSVLWKCSTESCSHEWIAKISDRSSGSGCPACHGRVASDKNRLSLFFPELTLEWDFEKNGDLTPDDVTYSSHKRVWWKCTTCFHEWETPVYSRTITLSNCPSCSESKGEKKIREFLLSKNIDFESQVTFENLLGVGNGNLSYDFYIRSRNLFIEFQGQQHEKYYKGFHKNKFDFIVQKEHDRRKREFAYINNIELLEIWYWDFDNIESILMKKIKH